MSDDENFINFRVKYKNLKVDKELNIRESTNKNGITKYLSEIDSWIDENIYKIFNIDIDILDKFINSYSMKAPDNNKFSYVADILSNKEAKKAVTDSCKDDKKIEPIARSYLIGGILKKLN